MENGVDELEDLPLVHDGPEGAVHQAHAAGDTLVVVDLGPAVLVGADGVHAAGPGAGAVQLDDGVVVARGGAFAAFDTGVLPDVALAVDKADGVLGTDLTAGLGQTTLTVLGDAVLPGGTGVAGVVDNIDEGRLVVLLRDGALTEALADQDPLVHRTKRQAHGEPHPLPGDGLLQEDGFPVHGLLAGDDHIGQVLHPVVVAVVGKPGHLGEHLLPDVGHR